MPDEDLLLDVPVAQFGAGVVGVCDVCHSRQAVIILNKERFKLCVIDFLNKNWLRTPEKPGARTLPFTSSSEFVPTSAVPGGVAISIHLRSLKTVRHPLVTIVPDVLGITAQVLEAGIRFARSGYDVVIPDTGRIPGIGLFNYALHRGFRVVTGSLAVAGSKRERLFKVLDACRASALEDPMIDGKRQAVFGLGYGGAMALAYAAETSGISGVALAYPYTISRMRTLSSIDCPIFTIYGDEDTQSGHACAQLKEAAAQLGLSLRIEVVDGGGHNFLSREHRNFDVGAAEAGWREILGFLKSRLEPAPPTPKPTPPPVTHAIPPSTTVPPPATNPKAAPASKPGPAQDPTRPPGP